MFKKIFNNNNIPKINLMIGMTGLYFQFFILNSHLDKINNQIKLIHMQINLHKK